MGEHEKTGDAAYEAISAVEEWTGLKAEAQETPHWAMTFVSEDGQAELMGLYSTTPLPVPGEGERITLHETVVVVAETRKHYYRDEETGRPQIFVWVRVRPPE
ncbi:hypothetical protein AB0L74_10360 [Streptomyces sp. NPDC052020]|uniref:hypothetical protein n=1 Tax=Streptomyces sp. NPDC052020 TaxID=3155677 RepID=UPI00344972A0